MSVPERRPPGAFLSPLILQAQQGDHRALNTLFNENRPRLLSLCIRILRNEAEAEQIVQDVFLETLQSLANFRGECPIQNWFLRKATNSCLNLLRTKKGADAVHGLSLDGMEAGDRPAESGIEDDVVESLFRKQLRALIHDCVRTARPPWDAFDADIFHLHYEQGIGARDVGKRLGRSENTVKYRISRHINPVLASVRARLQAEEEAI